MDFDSDYMDNIMNIIFDFMIDGSSVYEPMLILRFDYGYVSLKCN